MTNYQQRHTLQADDKSFAYSNERFADTQLLRYRLEGFDRLSLRQKTYIYHLAEASLYGRDILFDQNGKHNLRIRKMLETIYLYFNGNKEEPQWQALETYLKRVWFANGIHHHYGCEKFIPEFTEDYLRKCLYTVPLDKLPLQEGESLELFCSELFPVIFDPTILSKRVNQAAGEDLVLTSACNYYEGVTQDEVEDFYRKKKASASHESPSWGLNSKLVKQDGQLRELTWKVGGMYDASIKKITECLERAKEFAENDLQKEIINLLVDYYHTGDLHTFDRYSIKWVEEHQGEIDFINGFIEVYGDPLGLKASWESIVEYKDTEATKRTSIISDNAQWFEDHSPIDKRFKKTAVRGVTARVVRAAMLGGDEYPSTAIGINLPNAEWIRAKHGSKSVTISNLTDAYSKAAHGNGFREEFVSDPEILALIEQYGDICDNLHTDLHECLGHGSGQLLPSTDPDALKAYGSTIEEARADLFALYYLADPKMTELELLPSQEAYRANYYTYMMNGLMTQLTRIRQGHQIEEAHMRNRALIAHWAKEHGKGIVELVRREGKTYVEIHDYTELRHVFARLLAEIQRIKSEGDHEAARHLVETYAVKVDENLHAEIIERYNRLDLAPYKGFINPVLLPEYDMEGRITDIKVDYSESYSTQMLRYSKDYATL